MHTQALAEYRAAVLFHLPTLKVLDHRPSDAKEKVREQCHNMFMTWVWRCKDHCLCWWQTVVPFIAFWTDDLYQLTDKGSLSLSMTNWCLFVAFWSNDVSQWTGKGTLYMLMHILLYQLLYFELMIFAHCLWHGTPFRFQLWTGLHLRQK